ncbi:MAG: hypothetical protein ABR980_02445 [Ignavibacteriaceae bacterium]
MNEQLNEQARIFINDTTKNIFDLKSHKAFVSSIFESYEKEFGFNNKSTLIFLSNFLPKKIREDILANSDQWDLSFKSFNWSLNKID